MLAHRFDFLLRTNSDYTEELSFQVRDTYFDITGHSFLAQIRATPESTSILASLGMSGGVTAQGFYSDDPANGFLQIKILWETIRAMFLAIHPEVLTGDETSLYYDILVTLPGGDQEAWLYGFMNIAKGITNG